MREAGFRRGGRLKVKYEQSLMLNDGIEIVEALFQAGSLRDDIDASVRGRKDAEKFCRRASESLVRRAT